MNILGISGFYHDSAAALIQDGEVRAAAQQERFSRVKHDASFPAAAIEYCLREAGIDFEQVDFVTFYEKPLIKFDRLLETYLSFAPSGFNSFRKAIPTWLREKLFLPRTLDRELCGRYRGRYVFTEHHESHAASAFFPSPFEEAAILTVDGVGEWATATIAEGESNHLRIRKELHFPHSLGLLYSAFTYFTGFKVNSGEYKLMGLAPYGEPRYADLIKEKLIEIKPDGSFRMNLEYFNYCQGLTMTSRHFHHLFGSPPRRPESPLTQLQMDLAASIQRVTEEIMLKMARFAHQKTGKKKLCLAGGVALNCVANGRILEKSPFDKVWIQPAAGDAGGAIGAALLVWYQLLENPRRPRLEDSQRGSFLGPCFSTSEIESFLKSKSAVYQLAGDEEELQSRVARLIADQKVVGWFQGRMEFGPRALGARSILADPRSPEMQRIVNLKIKFRESFRPFAPSVLAEKASEIFELEPGQSSPYMLLVRRVKESLRRQNRAAIDSVGLEKMKFVRSDLPAVTHVDFSARVQTVDEVANKRFYGLLQAFYERTGCPVLINTSFNVRGEPIVCTPEDAYRCFMATEMDALAIGRFILLKNSQPESNRVAAEKHLSRFELD